ncbi:MAG: ParB/RepB/Spo0J family partition protein [Paludibacteraceae bacterium]|nr:ParB/RepB/Spo0J family partition protein [Paludibacteraceae bacterium]MBN2788188.1 ParB/RepB/Spo0J family partition protein [Paludibacteraceae bacterium]
MAKSVLGRGMGALLEMEEVSTAGSSAFGEIEIEKIRPNSNQPRTHFDEESLNELAASIKSVGVIQPITVRKQNDGTYQIIAGERRYRASKKAGLQKVPAYIKTAEDDQVLQLALIENIQRDDLNAIEEALGYQKLVEENNLTQDKLSELVGKKRATVANYLRLLKLPAEIQLGITAKKIDMGHARALINIENPIQQLEVYNAILANDFTVRKVEELVRSLKNKQEVDLKEPLEKKGLFQEKYQAIKASLSTSLQTRVELVCSDNGKGKIILPFNSEEELDQLIQILHTK